MPPEHSLTVAPDQGSTPREETNPRWEADPTQGKGQLGTE